MITSTSFNRHEAEQRVIDSVQSGSGLTTIVLTEPLEFEHAAKVVDFRNADNPDDIVEMRAEVALLERNVIFLGDEDSMRNEYGAHILIHAPGDNSNIGRISNVQLQNVG